MNYDQKKREALANAKHLVELLQEVSDENPNTTDDSRYELRRAAMQIKTAERCLLSILNRENNPQ